MHRHHHHGIGKNSDDDGRYAVQQVRRVANHERHGLPAKLGQVDSAQQADGNADQRRQQQELARADDGIGHAAAGFTDRRGQLGEEIPVYILAAVVDEVAENEEERRHRDSAHSPVRLSMITLTVFRHIEV